MQQTLLRPRPGQEALPLAERWSVTFRKRLLAGILLFNLIVVALAGLALYQSYVRAENDAIVATQNLANLLAHDLAARFDKIDLTVQSVVDEATRQLASGTINPVALNTYIARQQSRLTELDSLRVLDRQETIAYGAGVDSSTATLSAAHRDFFIKLRDDRAAGMVVSKPLVGQISRLWSIVLARRINLPDGDFGGVVFGVVFLDSFKKRLSELELGSRGVVSLRDLDLGTVVRHPEPATLQTAVGNPTHSLEWPQKLKENPVKGTYFAVGLDNLRRALSYERVQGHPFYVIVGLLPDDYLSAWRQEALRTASLLGVFALLTILFSRTMQDGWDSVTERKRAQKVLEDAYEAEQKVRAEAERVAQAKDDFIANLSPELRTPLAGVIGWSEVLVRTSQGAGLDAARAIKRMAHLQAQMIDDLLDMQRIVSGQIRLDLKRVDILALVRDVVETTKPSADAKQLFVTLHSDSASAWIRGDATRIQQILWNVVNNAVKFTPANGRVDIVVQENASHIRVLVTDTGRGIDSELLPHLFDRFRSLDGSHSRREGGLGLGLAIAKHLVELHGGYIEARSHGTGHGATFIVGFPVWSVDPAQE